MVYKYIISLMIATSSYSLSAGDFSPKFSDCESRSEVEQWLTAAHNGNLEHIKELINTVDINAQNNDGETALIKAAGRNHEHIVEFLLQFTGGPKIINVNAQDNFGYTALILAAQYGYENIIKLLLDGPIDPNVQNNEGNTALIVAASQHGHENIVELLLQIPGIDVNVQNKLNETALIRAASRGRKNIAKLLLEFPGTAINVQNNLGKSAITYVQRHSFKTIGQLIKNRISELTGELFETISCAKLIEAEREFNLAKIRSLIAQVGPNIENIIDHAGNTLLHKAFSCNNLAVILFLLSAVKDPQDALQTTNDSGLLPLELVNPSSALFEYFIDLAYSSRKTQQKKPDADLTAGPKKYKSCKLCSRESTAYCGKCKKVYYCSKECQAADWCQHKKCCRRET